MRKRANELWRVLKQIEFGEEALNKKNVKIDSNNLFYNIDYIDSAYPLLLKKNQEGKFTYSLLE